VESHTWHCFVICFCFVPVGRTAQEGAKISDTDWVGGGDVEGSHNLHLLADLFVSVHHEMKKHFSGASSEVRKVCPSLERREKKSLPHHL